MSRCIGLFGVKSMEECKAKERCKGFFRTDINLQKGCQSWVKTLNNPRGEFQTPEDYLRTLNQDLLIATYGTDFIKDDDVTLATVFGDKNDIFKILGLLLAILLIYYLWTR
jgi:hypothetical protein